MSMGGIGKSRMDRRNGGSEESADRARGLSADPVCTSTARQSLDVPALYACRLRWTMRMMRSCGRSPSGRDPSLSAGFPAPLRASLSPSVRLRSVPQIGTGAADARDQAAKCKAGTADACRGQSGQRARVHTECGLGRCFGRCHGRAQADGERRGQAQRQGEGSDARGERSRLGVGRRVGVLRTRISDAGAPAARVAVPHQRRGCAASLCRAALAISLIVPDVHFRHFFPASEVELCLGAEDAIGSDGRDAACTRSGRALRRGSRASPDSPGLAHAIPDLFWPMKIPAVACPRLLVHSSWGVSPFCALRSRSCCGRQVAVAFQSGRRSL